MSYSSLVAQEAGKAGLPFISRRSPVHGTRGMVACSQPLAAEAGMRILQQGGNAADAAVAVAAALNVTEPCSTGIGGDAFALYFEPKAKRVHCMMGNGRSPAALTLDWVHAQGVTGHELPPFHAMTATVPGAAALWDDAVSQWGRLRLEQVLQPAIELAERGFPVSPISSFFWQKGEGQLTRAHPRGSQNGTCALLLPDGTAPKPGQLFRNADLAATFRSLAKHGAKEGFYRGRIAEAIVNALQQQNGAMALSDLEAHQTEVVEPISTTFRGATIWETPPPTQGIVALMALNLFEADERLGKSVGHGSAAWMHSAIESLRLAFADGLEYVADPTVVRVPVEQLLSKERAKARRAEAFDESKACRPSPDPALAPAPSTKGGDTVYFCVMDGEGGGCSFINSNYMGFGTGIVPEGCGFSIQNRGHNFTLQPGHPNCLGPSKRPYHTIIPGMATDAEGDLLMTFGVMGGFMQPQGHLQVLSNMFDAKMDPQAALDAPRFCIDQVDSAVGPASVSDSVVLLEEGIDEKVAQELQKRGHAVGSPGSKSIQLVTGEARALFGRGQVIVRDKQSGVLSAGSDPRADGCALGW